MRAYRFLGTTDEVTTCDCCGRSKLKNTVALHDNETGEDLHFGVVCAARALSLTSKEVKAAAKKADDEKAEQARIAREAADRAEMARWSAFLGAQPEAVFERGGKVDIFRTIQAIGGMKIASARYEAMNA